MKYIFKGNGKETFVRIAKRKVELTFTPGDVLDTSKHEDWVIAGLVSTGKFALISKKETAKNAGDIK